MRGFVELSDKCSVIVNSSGIDIVMKISLESWMVKAGR